MVVAYMRKTKFRCWDTEKSVMIYDSVCDRSNRGWEDSRTYLNIEFDGAITGQVDDDGQKNGLHEHDARMNNTRMILLQWTGMKDKKGKDIYEGDVVRIDTIWQGKQEYITREILFEDGVFGIKPDDKWDMADWKIVPLFIPKGFLQQDTEVIGNVYETFPDWNVEIKN